MSSEDVTLQDLFRVMNEMRASVDSLRGELRAAKSELGEQIDGLGAQQSAMQRQIGGLNDQFVAMNRQLGGMSDQVGALTSVINGHTAQLRGIGGAVQTVIDRLDRAHVPAE